MLSKNSIGNEYRPNLTPFVHSWKLFGKNMKIILVRVRNMYFFIFLFFLIFFFNNSWNIK